MWRKLSLASSSRPSLQPGDVAGVRRVHEQAIELELALGQFPGRSARLGDVAQHPVGADESGAFSAILVLVQPGGGELEDAGGVGAGPVLELEVPRGALAGAALVEMMAQRLRQIGADHLLPGEAADVFRSGIEDLRYRLVGEGETALVVEHVDQIRRLIHQELVQRVVGLRAGGQGLGSALETPALHRVGDAGQQLLGLIGLRQVSRRRRGAGSA
jgi:hypothetical protein